MAMGCLESVYTEWGTRTWAAVFAAREPQTQAVLWPQATCPLGLGPGPWVQSCRLGLWIVKITGSHLGFIYTHFKDKEISWLATHLGS